MEAPLRLTPGAVKAIAEQTDGAETGKPVLQGLDVRPVTTANSERFRMALSDGVHAQQSMLATALNHLVTGGALRPGAIVHLLDMTCSTIQKRRIIIVVKLDILQSECTIIGSPKMYSTRQKTYLMDRSLTYLPMLLRLIVEPIPVAQACWDLVLLQVQGQSRLLIPHCMVDPIMGFKAQLTLLLIGKMNLVLTMCSLVDPSLKI